MRYWCARCGQVLMNDSSERNWHWENFHWTVGYWAWWSPRPDKILCMRCFNRSIWEYRRGAGEKPVGLSDSSTAQGSPTGYI